MATVVVCDDDTVVRGAISSVCEDAGLEVVAETDSGADAAEMVRRFGVDVLVLDLVARRRLRRAHPRDARAPTGSRAEVVVFTAYAAIAPRLLRLGAREVIEKPDFELLSDVLVQLVGLDRRARPAGRAARSRAASRDVEQPPTMWRSPAGVSLAPRPRHSLLDMEIGDAVLAVTVVGLEALEADVGPLLTADCRLGGRRHPARRASRPGPAARGAGDRAASSPSLRGGDARAGRGRLVAPHGRGCATLVAARVRSRAPRAAVDARRAPTMRSPGRSARCRGARAGQPAFVSV